MSKRRILGSLSAAALGLLALLAGVVYFANSLEFERYIADAIVGFLEERTGAEVTLEHFDADFRSQRFTLEGLVLRGDEGPSSRPLARVERIEIEFRLRALLSRQVDLSSLRIERPEIALQIGEDGATNVPSPRAPPQEGGGTLPFELFVGDLVVSDGGFQINEQRVDIDFELSALNGRFEYAEQTGVLSGHLEYSGGLERVSAPLIPYDLSADFDYTAGTVLLHTVDLVSDETRMTLHGRIDDLPGEREGGLDYAGVIDLPFLNYFFQDERFQGSMDVEGQLRFGPGRFSTGGRFSAPRLTLEDWVATNVESDYAYAFPARVLEASNLEADVAGGRVVGTARVGPLPGTSTVEVDLQYQNIDTAELRRLYPWDPSYVIRSRARGRLSGWFQGKFQEFELSGDAVLAAPVVPLQAGRFPEQIRGSTVFHAVPGSLTLEGARIQFGSTRINAGGVVQGTDSELDVRLESGNLADLVFLTDLAAGSGTFEGAIRGNLGRPDVEGRFTLADYPYQEWVIDQMEGRATLSDDLLDLGEVRVLEGGSEVVVDGRYDLASGEPDLDFTLVRLEGEHLRRVIDQPIEGVVSGDVHLSKIEPLEIAGQLQIDDFAYRGRPVGHVNTEIVWSPSEIRLSELSVRQGAQTLDGRATYEWDTARLDVEFHSTGMRLEDFDWLGVPVDLGGTVREADFQIAGTLSEPAANGRAVIDELRFREQYFPQAVIELADQGRSMHVGMETDSHLQIEADVNIDAGGFPFSGIARLREYDASPWINALPGGLTVTGNVSFDGSLTDMASLTGRGEIAALTTFFEDYELRVSRPFSFSFDTETLRLSGMTLDGAVTSLNVAGAIGLSAAAPLDLRVNGDVDLMELLESRDWDWVADGRLALGGEIQGNMANPELTGLANLQNVSLSHSSLPISLSSLNGDLYFDRNRIGINEIRGNAGGGNIVISGGVGLEGPALGVVDLRLDAFRIRVRDDSGLRTEFDGALALRGTTADPRLEGDIEVLSLTFGRSFEEFLALFGSGVQTGDAGGPLDEMALAVRVRGNRNIRIENELVQVESRLDLDVGGTYGDPGLTGHVEVTNGTLNFQGARYRITRGNVDFVDPIQIEPLVDVEAETEVRDYRIILTISGRGEDFQLSMRSDPPLSELEIVSLIAGGRTREEFAAAQGADGALPTSEELFQGGAATILADLLQSRVGSRLGVLSGVRIDPFLVGAENDPVARVTISEQITRDLTITYSQDLSSNSQQIILIEYFLSNDTSFIASRDETGALGLDVKLRKRFR